MWRYVELFRKYGLPVIGGTAAITGAAELIKSVGLSFASVDQAAPKDHLNFSCYLGLAAILCAAGYFFIPRPASNPTAPEQN